MLHVIYRNTTLFVVKDIIMRLIVEVGASEDYFGGSYCNEFTATAFCRLVSVLNISHENLETICACSIVLSI